MITMYSDHALTSSGLALLKIIQPSPVTAEQVASHVAYPIYRVRVSLTELQDAKLLKFNEGKYQLTDTGLQRIREQEA